LIPYNGNLLLDGVSDIVQKPCPGEIAYNKNNLPPHKRTKTNPKSNNSSSKPSGTVKDTPVVVVDNAPKKPKILTELNRSTLKEGQVIEIKRLEFMADTSKINSASYEVLDEVYNFLKGNPEVIVEIGGHTNNIPPDAYCDQLSTARAKVVAEYLINKGIKTDKIQFKGYGKRKPIADNKTAIGRQRNQRVEIKILSIT
jgi:outer membrane protein OmpA-like peptidoglycan-associated protein